MAESETTQSASSGPSLEAILWRNLDRWSERPALVDHEEFTGRIAAAFDGETPSEAFIERFFNGDPEALLKKPADMAEAIVRASRERMHVYEFDLDRLEYVVLEEDDKMVVVSDFASFAIENNDVVSRAVKAAILPETKQGTTRQPGASSEPRAYLVKKDGTMIGLDVARMARALERFKVEQVSLPDVVDPRGRLQSFEPSSARSLTAEREMDLLRRDARTRRELPPPPPGLLPSLDGLLPMGVASASPAQATENTVLLLLPDGSVARPAMGSATRWKDMISDWALRASALSLTTAASARPLSVTGEGRYAVQANQIIALFSGGGQDGAQLGGLGERATGRGEGIAMARSGGASVRVLGDDELALAVSRGAVLMPGWATQASGDGFWVQPEAYFLPSADEKQKLSRSALGRDGQDDMLVAANAPPELEGAAGLAGPGGKPLPLGAVTGDPWADWALSTGGKLDAGTLAAARDRAKDAGATTLLASLDRPQGTLVAGPGGQDLRLPGGEPLVAYTGADGSVIVQRRVPAFQIAEGRGPQAPQPASEAPLRIGARAGALPSTVLAALSMALERTAGAGGFKLPALRIWSAPDAIERGEGLGQSLAANDPRRAQAMLAGAPSVYSDANGQVARLVLSLPFPNSGELHVGPDLADALQSYIGAPAVPASASSETSGGAAVALAASSSSASVARVGRQAAAEPVSLQILPGGSARGTAQSIAGPSAAWTNANGSAASQARSAALSLRLPEVAPLLARSGPSVAGLPPLLAQALQASDGWTAGPGQAPAALQRFAFQSPFELPEGALPAQQQADVPRRQASLGEHEIVIPMPLWAQMGRGKLSSTDQFSVAPRAQPDYVPPMGAYRLQPPNGGFPMSFAASAPAGSQAVTQLAGPTSLELAPNAQRTSLAAQSPSGSFTLGNVPAEPQQSGRRGRGRIGAPLATGTIVARFETGAPGAESALADSAPGATFAGTARSVRGQRAADGAAGLARPTSDSAQLRTDSAESSKSESSQTSELRVKAEQAHRDANNARGESQAPARVLASPERPAPAPRQKSDEPVAEAAPESSPRFASRAPAAADPELPMTSALHGALRTSDEVASRLSASKGPGALSSSGLSAPLMPLATPASQQARPALSPEASETPASSNASPSRTSSTSNRASANNAFNSSSESPGSTLTVTRGEPRVAHAPARALVASPPEDRGSHGSPVTVADANASRSGAASSVTTGQDLDRSTSEAVRVSQAAARRSRSARLASFDTTSLGSSASFATSSGATSFASGRRYGRSTSTSSSVALDGLGKPSYPTLPGGLRFRYAAAPLWWSSSSRGGASFSSDSSTSAGGDSTVTTGSSPAHRALRAGLRAANSAAAIWRSILVRGGGEGEGGGSELPAQADSGPARSSDAGAMDRSWDTSANKLSSLSSRLDALQSATLVRDGGAGGTGAAAAAQGAAAAKSSGPDSIYVAVDRAGRAGPASLADAGNKLTQVEMSIVAAVPPKPPSLESMASSSSGELAPAHTRRTGAAGGGSQAAEAPEAAGEAGQANGGTSSAKIEGSVDAIAQRIYHRIRRRIASDRERFGG